MPLQCDNSESKTTCIRWNFSNRFTLSSIIFGTIYFVIPPLNISYWLWRNHFCCIPNWLIMEQFSAANFQILLFCISKSFFFHFFCEFILSPKYIVSYFCKNINLSGWIINPIKFKGFIDVMTFLTLSSNGSPRFIRSLI